MTGSRSSNVGTAGAGVRCLHTAAEHVERFSRVAADLPSRLVLRHDVRADLLAMALEGKDRELQRALAVYLDGLEGGECLLVTCSSIGGAVEVLAGTRGVTTVRVDRPMMEAAARAHDRITLMATAPSTLAPSLALLEDATRRVGHSVDIETLLVPSAWQAFVAGDAGLYARRIADAVAAVPASRAIIFAQVSMADALPHSTGDRTIYTSIESGLRAAVAKARVASMRTRKALP